MTEQVITEDQSGHCLDHGNSANLKADVRAAAKQAQINYLLTEQKAQLKALYSQGQTARLLHSDSIKEVCAEESARAKLEDLDIEAAIGLLPDQENN